MPRRESTVLLFWGAAVFWSGLFAAACCGVWAAYDVMQIHSPTIAGMRLLIFDRVVMIGFCHVISLLGGITYRISQAS